MKRNMELKWNIRIFCIFFVLWISWIPYSYMRTGTFVDIPSRMAKTKMHPCRKNLPPVQKRFTLQDSPRLSEPVRMSDHCSSFTWTFLHFKMNIVVVGFCYLVCWCKLLDIHHSLSIVYLCLFKVNSATVVDGVASYSLCFPQAACGANLLPDISCEGYFTGRNRDTMLALMQEYCIPKLLS